MKKIILILTTLALYLNVQAQYPLTPQNQQHYINGTVGEERGGTPQARRPRTRYHYGLDLPNFEYWLTHVVIPATGNYQIDNFKPFIREVGVNFILNSTNYTLYYNRWDPLPGNKPEESKVQLGTRSEQGIPSTAAVASGSLTVYLN